METTNVMLGQVVTSINVWAVLVAAVISVTGITFMAGGVRALIKSGDPLARSIAGVTVVVGTLLLVTLALAITFDAHPQVFMPAFMLEFGALGLVFWVVTLADCATREPDQGNNKIVWVLIIILTHLIGAALYWLVRRPARLAEAGR